MTRKRRRDWFTAAEIAAAFGVQPLTVRRWIITGKLEGEVAHKNTYLVHASAIEKFKARRHTDDTPPPARQKAPTDASRMRRSIEPDKRYRIKSTGEIVTGAELLWGRGEA